MRFALEAHRQLREIVLRVLACVGVALPRLVQNVARLEILPVARLLEHQVFGERLFRIANVQAREHHRRGASRYTGCDGTGAAHRRGHRRHRGRRRRGHRNRRLCIVRDPEHAGRSQLVFRKWIGGAGIAPAHVPEIFGERDAVFLLLRLLGEHRLVEAREVAFDVGRHVDIRRHLNRPIVRRLDTAVLRQHVDDHVLRPARVHHAEADRQHELLALECELQRAQIGEAGLRLLLQIHFRDEELEVLPDVRLESSRSPSRDLVAVLLQPRLETVGLVRRQDHDVVLADRVLRFDDDAERSGIAGSLRRRGCRRTHP